MTDDPLTPQAVTDAPPGRTCYASTDDNLLAPCRNPAVAIVHVMALHLPMCATHWPSTDRYGQGTP